MLIVGLSSQIISQSSRYSTWYVNGVHMITAEQELSPKVQQPKFASIEHPKKMGRDRIYLEPLTWLRGIAAFFVIVSHCLRATEVKYFPSDSPGALLVLRWLDLGNFGVVLFFALSGLTLFLSNSFVGTQKSVIGFYVKRFFRIWPAFVVSLFIYLIFNEFFCRHYTGAINGYLIENHLRPYNLTDVLTYLALTFNFTGPEELFNFAYWSLPVEFQYYLIFPLAVLLMKRFGGKAIFLMGAVLFLIGTKRWLPFDNFKVFLLAYSFLGGIYLGTLDFAKLPKISYRLALWILAAIVVAVSVIANKYVTLPKVPFFHKEWNYYIPAALLSIYVILCADFTQLPNQLKRFLQRCGEMSFSAYLFHQIFVAMSVLFIVKYHVTGLDKLLLTFPFTILATYYFSQLSYRFIEKPFVNLSRQLVTRFQLT